MARYQNAIQTHDPALAYENQVSQYLLGEGFSQVNYKGAMIWKKGLGIMTGPQFINVYYQDNTIYLEAFIKFAILPGVYAGEMGITGAFGAIPKKVLRDRVRTIEAYITGIAAPRVQQPPPPPQSAPQM